MISRLLRCWFYPWDEITIVWTAGPVREVKKPVHAGPQHRHRPTRKRDMARILTDSQQDVYAISFADKKGNPTTPPTGKPAWTTSDPDIITVTPADDGLSATVVAVGKLGHAQVQVTAGPLIGTLDFQVIAGDATQIVLTPTGAPTEQP